MQMSHMDEAAGTIYHAPNPFPPPTTLALLKKIAIRIVFPPLLVWDVLSFSANFIWGRASGKRILGIKSINSKNGPLYEYDLNRLAQDNKNLIFKKFSVSTHDRARLDSIEIKHIETATKPPSEQKYIVNFTGKSDCYERKMASLCAEANEFKCTVVGFNFRGIRKSKKSPTGCRDLVIDGIAQVQRLLDNGILPQNIMIKGHSLGGGIAALVTEHFHHKGIPLRVFSHNSFSSLSNVIIGWVRMTGPGKHKDGHNETWYGKMLGWLAWPFVKTAFHLVGWEINAASALKKLPHENIDYTLVRSHRDERQAPQENPTIDDPVVSHWASVHMAFKPERKEKTTLLKTAIQLLKNRQARSPDDEEQLASLTLQLNRLKNRKMPGGPIEPTEKPHKHHSGELHQQPIRASWESPHCQTSQQFFGSFFNGRSSLAISLETERKNHLDLRLKR